MKSAELLSISQTARILQVDRRTIARYLEAGLIQWHGKKRRGRDATGIILREARKVVSSRTRHKSDITRKKCKSIFHDIKKFLASHIKPQPPAYNLPPKLEAAYNAARPPDCVSLPNAPEHKPEDVLRMYFLAATAADIDFMLYCFGRLREGDETFIRMVMGDAINPLLCDELRVYAAQCMRELALRAAERSAGIVFPTLSLENWFALFIQALCQAQPDVVVTVVIDEGTQKASLELLPKWLAEAPVGFLPSAGGHHSLIKVRRTERSDDVGTVATKVALRLRNTNGRFILTQDNTPKLRVLLNYKDEDLANDIRQITGQNITVEEYVHDRKQSSTSKRPVSFNVLQSFCDHAQSLSLTPDQAWIFVRRWRQMEADLLSISTLIFNEMRNPAQTRPRKRSKKSIHNSSGHRKFMTRIAEIIGCSRPTVRKWINKGTALQKQLKQSTASHINSNQHAVPSNNAWEQVEINPKELPNN